MSSEPTVTGARWNPTTLGDPFTQGAYPKTGEGSWVVYNTQPSHYNFAALDGVGPFCKEPRTCRFISLEAVDKQTRSETDAQTGRDDDNIGDEHLQNHQQAGGLEGAGGFLLQRLCCAGLTTPCKGPRSQHTCGMYRASLSGTALMLWGIDTFRTWVPLPLTCLTRKRHLLRRRTSTGPYRVRVRLVAYVAL